MPATSLPRPGVQVIQQFRAVTPTVITPTLVPNITGVCKQVVEVLVGDGAGGQELNGDSLLLLPASFIASDAIGSPAKYLGLNGKKFAVSVNNSAVKTVTFSDPASAGLPPSSVVDQVNTQLVAAGMTSAQALLVSEGIASPKSFEFRTVGVGEFQKIYIDSTTDAVVLSAFGIGVGQTYVGIGNYNQYSLSIPSLAFPDPRGNIAELSIEDDSVRVFLSMGNGADIQEAKRTESFLQAALVGTQASITSTPIIGTWPDDLWDETLNLLVNGDEVNYTFPSTGGPTDLATMAAWLTGVLERVTVTVATLDLVWTTDDYGKSASIASNSTGTLNTILGLSTQTDDGTSIESIDDGDGDAVTSWIQFAGQDFTDAPASPADKPALTGTGDPTYGSITAGMTLILSDGHQPQTIVFDGTEAVIADIVDAINAVMAPAVGGKITASTTLTNLILTHSDIGEEAMIEILGGTAAGLLDDDATPTLFVGAKVVGKPFIPIPEDDLYIDGVFYGIITEVAPAGNVDVLKVDQLVPISDDVGARYTIQAKNLEWPQLTGRPLPDLFIDLQGNANVKHSIVRESEGTVPAVRAPLYLMYTAVRLDVTALAVNPGLLRFDDTLQLEQALEPISTSNPLALGLFFALLNAPGIQVTGLGVDEISADMPYGTVEGFTRAAEYLEGFEVYGIAPLTHDTTVAQVFSTHVSVMSEPENRGERIVLINPNIPTNALDTLVASGTTGDGLTTITFDTKISNLSALLVNAGVDAGYVAGVIPVEVGVFLDISADANKYSVKSVSGSVVTLRTTAGDFAAGSNDDDYYAEETLPLPLINEIFSVRVRGAALVTTTGQEDKDAVAENVSALGVSFGSRRVWMTFPDRAGATIEGLEQVVEGFYMGAATVGLIGQQPPHQSFTNFPVAGFTRVIGSNDRYSERQLDLMAGGGAYIFIQEGADTAIFSRHALTTDQTSIETRTDSVTKVVDFTAKFMRKALRVFIGRFNITQGFLDSLGTTVQGLGGFLVETGVLIGMTLDNIIQDEDQRDTVLIDTTLDVPIPCNYIKLTLLV